MKPLIISLEYYPKKGGIASYVLNLSKNLKAQNPILMAPKVIGNFKEEVAQFDASMPFKTARVDFFWWIYPRWFKTFFLARKIIKKEKCDTLLIHHCLPIGHIGYILKKLFHFPYWIFFHGTDLELASLGAYKKSRTDRILKTADRVVVNSEFLKNKLLEKFPKVKAEKITVLHPCPADEFFISYSSDELETLKSKLALGGKKVVLTVGRLDEGKGFPLLLKLFPKILQEVPDLLWIIIGSGKKEKEIMDMIQNNHWQNSLRFLGEIEYSELPKYYQLANLFVLLSHKDNNKEESWGTVFVEAAASGLAVVAGNAGGVPEAVQDRITGFIVDPYDESQTTQAIIGLLLDKNLARQMGEKGKMRAQSEFRWEKEIEKLI